MASFLRIGAQGGVCLRSGSVLDVMVYYYLLIFVGFLLLRSQLETSFVLLLHTSVEGSSSFLPVFGPHGP